ERDEAVNYIERQRLAPTISRERIAEFFEARARHLEDGDFADLIAEALRPVAALSLTVDVVRIAELVAAADPRLDPNEAQVVSLIRLISKPPADTKAARSARSSVDWVDGSRRTRTGGRIFQNPSREEREPGANDER